MPNPHHDEAGKFTSPPEQSGPDWSAFEQAGITPDQFDRVQRAMALDADLNNLDRRQDAFRRIYREDIDGNWLRPVQNEPEDPYQQYAQPEPEQEYYEPPAPQIDFAQFGQTVEERAVQRATAMWEQRLQQMFAEQQFTEAAQAAVTEAKLPPFMAGDVEQQARMMAQQQPNRPPADITREIVAQRRAQFDEFLQASAAPTLPGPSTPGGPVPSTIEAGPPPGVDPGQWASEVSKAGLD